MASKKKQEKDEPDFGYVVEYEDGMVHEWIFDTREKAEEWANEDAEGEERDAGYSYTIYQLKRICLGDVIYKREVEW